MAKTRPSQHANETAMEYLRRVVGNCDHEMEDLLFDLPSVEAILDFYDLWHAYDTDFWSGVLDCIAEGDSPAKARAFVRKYKLPASWTRELDHVLENRDSVIVERSR